MRWDIFIHTWKSVMRNAFFARLWTTLLPFLLTWEYNNHSKLLATLFTLSTSKPVGDRLHSIDFKALIWSRESPSRVALWKPNSHANVTALRAASASTSSGLWAWWIFSEQEASTTPLLSQITTNYATWNWFPLEYFFKALIGLTPIVRASWLVDSKSSVTILANNNSSLLFIFAKNVSYCNTSSKIEGVLIKLDLLLIGMDFWQH